MKIRILFCSCLAVLYSFVTGCSPNSHRDTSASADSALLSAFVDGLNGGDVKLKAYIEKWCSDAVPVEQRLERLKGVAVQGAPFKIVRVVSESKAELRAELQDREGLKLSLRMELNESGKMNRVQIMPLEAADAPPPKDYRGYKSLAALAESIRADSKSPAMGLAVSSNGKVEAVASGVRELGRKEEVGIDEPWSVGSIGKPICTTLIARLIEMGKLSWDTTLAQALKGFTMHEGYRSVTIEQLMQHRGGIPQDLGMNRAQVESIVAGATDPKSVRENYTKNILGRAPIAKPGERNAYSNAGYALLGAIAEQAAGKSYEALVKELVFSPLGLKNSYMAGDTLPANKPKGHLPGPEGLRPMDFSGPMEIFFAPAGGGIWMSTRDLVKLGQAHLDGLLGKDGLLKSETVKRLHRGIAEEEGGDFRYGCGWGIHQVPGGLTLHGHNGSNGTMRAQLAIFPSLNLVVAAFVNSGGELEPAPPLQAAVAIARTLAGR